MLLTGTSTTNARAFVGGSEYFPVLADTLVAAQREILIADWWLTPMIYLKRDPCEVHYNLLITVTEQKGSLEIRQHLVRKSQRGGKNQGVALSGSPGNC